MPFLVCYIRSSSWFRVVIWFISLSLGFLKNTEVGFYALEGYLAVFPKSPCLAKCLPARDGGENWHESKKRIEGGGGGAYRSPEETVALVYFIGMWFY